MGSGVEELGVWDWFGGFWGGVGDRYVEFLIGMKTSILCNWTQSFACFSLLVKLLGEKSFNICSMDVVDERQYEGAGTTGEVICQKQNVMMLVER